MKDLKYTALVFWAATIMLTLTGCRSAMLDSLISAPPIVWYISFTGTFVIFGIMFIVGRRNEDIEDQSRGIKGMVITALFAIMAILVSFL